MANYLTSGNHKLELGLGVSLTNRGENKYRLTETFPSLSYSIAYRYQPDELGIFFRVGATRIFYFGFPFQISLGYAF